MKKEIEILDTEGKEKGKFTLDPEVFDGKINMTLLQRARVAYLANQRKGLACTKTRGEVKGSGRKPWRQKGTGRARIGSIRSPLWYKGGIVFGPKPRSYHQDLPRRMKILALKSALNAKLKDEEIMLLEKINLNSYKTKEFFNLIKNLNLEDKKTRFVVDILKDNIQLASRNLPFVELSLAKDLSSYEALDCKKLVFTKSALELIIERIKKWI